MPIIDLQRRMVEAGRIRAGEKGDRGEPRKLDKWRLTSKDRQRLDDAAQLWGGEVRAWAEQWEVYTDTATLPIMLLPGQLPTTWYELWSKGGCQRRCDGQHELISDSSCLCGEERECKPYTRLSVLLPDLPGIGSWLLSSTGWNAAAELVGTADLLQRASAQGVLVPARLRLEQRTQVTGGQTRKFAVPVIDLAVSFRALLGGNQGALTTPSEVRALPSGYTPIESNGGEQVSLAQGLAVAETQVLVKRPRVELPEDDVLDDEPEAPASGGEPTPPDGSPTEPPATGNTVAASTRDKPRTEAQAKKLNVLVGKLRDEQGRITTEQLWRKLAGWRSVDVTTMIDLYPDAYTADGVLHWSPLRDGNKGKDPEHYDGLTRAEANTLIDALEGMES